MPNSQPNLTQDLPLLTEALDRNPEGVVLFDPDFRILYANPASRRISRIADSDIGTRTHWEIFPETIGTVIEETYRRVLATGVAENLPDFLYAPFNLWVRVHAAPTGSGIVIFYRDVSLEHQLEEKNRSIEDRLRFALEAANGVGAWDWDIVNDRVHSDARFALLYGVTPEEAAAGITIARFTQNIHPDDIVTVGPLIQKSIATGGDFASEYRLVQPDGSIRWVYARGRTLLDDSGKAVRFPGVTVDITEQKEQAEQLRISEERYRVLTELSPQSQWSADPAGRVLYANKRFLDYIGQEFIPRTGEEYVMCFDPADRDRVVATWTRSVTTGEIYSIDARLLRASDGASRWWHLEALPLRNDAGEVLQWLGTAADVHDVRIANQRLQEQYAEIDRNRRELEAIYHGSPIGMALYEPRELRLTRINNRQAEVFRLDPETAIGMRYEDITAGVPEAHRLIRRAAAGEAVLNHDIEGAINRHPDEQRFWNVNYSPIFAEDGAVQAIASATIETTAQKQAERALIQAEKLAAVGRLASSIAHEINNPLEAVTNLLYLANSHANNPEVSNFLDLAEQELRRVSVIANQTLRFHKQSTRPTEITADELFENVLGLYEGRLKNSNVIVLRRKRANCPVACFEGDVRQVLNNLVGNAIDAMSTGGRLILRCRESIDWPTGRKGLTLTIADNGTGIAEDAQEHIFEAFYTTKGYNGTGLGLWISKDIINRHQGRLRMRSSTRPSGHGTVFTLFLPFDGPSTLATPVHAEA